MIQSSLQDDKIGVICILHHIIAVGDWSQISSMDCIRGWAYDRTLDDACKDVEEIGELEMEFGAVGTIIEKVSDPIIDVIRNSHIRHFKYSTPIYKI